MKLLEKIDSLILSIKNKRKTIAGLGILEARAKEIKHDLEDIKNGI